MKQKNWKKKLEHIVAV